MSNIGFRAPAILTLLLGLLPLGALLKLAALKRIEDIRNLGLPPDSSCLKSVFFIFIPITMMIIAAARPYSGMEEYEIDTDNREIMIVFDVSASMLTRDVFPNRLEAARRKLIDFLADLRKAERNYRIGVTVFAGEAFLFCPLTSDYRVVENYLRSARTDLILSKGSDLSSGITAGISGFNSKRSAKRNILLITDGEDNLLIPEAVLHQLSSFSIKTAIIGVGTLEGQPVEPEEGRFIHDQDGNVVISSLAEKDLQNLARRSGGIYQRLSLGQNDIKAVKAFMNKGRSSSDNQKGKIVSYNEIGPFFLLIALICICFFSWWKWPGSIIPIILFSVSGALYSPQPLFAELPGAVERKAFLSYQAGDYDNVIDVLSEQIKTTPDRPLINRLLASAYFKTGRFDEANQLFSEGLKHSSNQVSSFENSYNLGTSLLMSSAYPEAIKNLEKSVNLQPDNIKAKHNLELAKELLKRQKKAEDKQDKKAEDESSEQSENDKEPDSQAKDQSGPDKNKEQKAPSSSEQEKQETAQEKSKTDLKEQQEKESKPDASSSPSKTEPDKPVGDNELEKERAKAWLDSLPESPLLLRRYGNRTKEANGQQW